MNSRSATDDGAWRAWVKEIAELLPEGGVTMFWDDLEAVCRGEPPARMVYGVTSPPETAAAKTT